MRKFRHLLSFAALALLACAPAATPIASVAAGSVASVPVVDSTREQTADEQVKHALNRLAFGARPGDVERVRAMGVDRWITLQLQPQRIDDAATERFLERFPTLDMSPAELMREYPTPAMLRQRAPGGRRRQRAMPNDSARRAMLSPEDSAALRRAAQASRRVLGDLQAAKVARAVASERQLEEVMVDFWENHFSVFGGKGPERYFLASYDRDVIRPHALGRFRDLLESVARSPAMLFYLDNWQSSVEPGRPTLDARGDARRAMRGGRARPGVRMARSGLNENYARELLELHTLGVDGGYTQQDIINVARALTGWSLDAPRRSGEGFVFRPQMHDAGEKLVLGRKLGARRGIEDGEDVLDIVARHPSTARFIATKLVRRFVSDSPPGGLVERVAATFTRTDGDIRETVRAVVTSPEFFSRQAYRAKVKSPFELVVSGMRALGARPDSTPRTAQVVARLGQPLFLHQAPNGYPETGDAWINTGAILNRINFGLALAGGRLPGATVAGWAGARQLSSASRAEQVDGVIRTLLGGEASPDTRRILESGVNPLLAGAAPDTAAVPLEAEGLDGEMRAQEDGMRPRRDARGNPLGRPVELRGLEQIVGLALGAPEFQRR